MTMPADVELARRPGVELVRTGRFQTLTGSWNPTPADIRAAVEAMDCPAIRKPVIRLGHTDQRFVGDGEPALGWFENLRAADDGHTLVADQVTLPWLHSVQAAAYPSRSVEGNYNHRCSEGHTHPFVIHTVALLGVTPPGVQTLRSLNDLPDMLGVAASGEVPEGAEHVQVTILAAEPTPDGDGDDDDEPTGAIVALIPTAEDATRLAVDGGEPADELHLTLAYLGDAADLDAAARQDLLDTVTSLVNGLPQIQANAGSVAVFNPGDSTDNDACQVYLFTSDLLGDVQDALDDALDDPDFAPEPWIPHITARYSADLSGLADLVANLGPVTFDRVRIAIAGQATDVPLIDYTTAGDLEGAGDLDGYDDQEEPVMAAGMPGHGNPGALKQYWTTNPKALALWASTPHPWTNLYHQLLRFLPDDEAKRTAAQWYHTVFKTWPGAKGGGDKAVHASADPSQPDAPASELPAAEPEQPHTDPKEDHVSDLSEVRSRLGLDDTADEQAILSALDELKAKADTPAEPTPEMVAASAAATEKATKAEEANALMREELTKVRAELDVIKASAASTVKASFFSGLVTSGRLKPADRETWEARYDRDAEMVTEILGGRAEGSEVPVMASGTVGSADPETAEDVDAEFEREFGDLFSRKVN